MGVKQEVAFMRNNEIFRRLEKVTSVASLTPEERRSYEADVKNARDSLNQLRGAEQRGHAKGLEEGRAEGQAEEKVSIARNMLKEGMKPEFVSAMTGLPLTDIQILYN